LRPQETSGLEKKNPPVRNRGNRQLKLFYLLLQSIGFPLLAAVKGVRKNFAKKSSVAQEKLYARLYYQSTHIK